MKLISSKQVSDSCSDNRKSRTCPESYRRLQNPKWAAALTIVFTLAIGGAAALAQQPTKVPRIGYLAANSFLANAARIAGFQQGLRELGYVEGKNILIEWRSAAGNPDRLPALAAELVSLKVDVLVSYGPIPTRAAKEATATIPIVMSQDGDPIASGFVASLAQPGANITGLSSLAPEISGKQLEILKEIVPKLSRVAVLGQFKRARQRTIVKRTGARRRSIQSTGPLPKRPKSQGY